MSGRGAFGPARGGPRVPAGGLACAVGFLLTFLAGAHASAEEGFRCELKASAGVPQADAATAAGIVCAEIRRESGARGAYTLTLGSLGRLLVVGATREETGESVHVQVEGLEEVPIAAKRVAESLVRRRDFAATQRVDNLLETETRLAPSKKGSVKFSVGVADLESLGHGGRGAAFSLGLVYAAPRLALPVEMRFGWDSAASTQRGIGLFSVSVGARRYLSTGDAGPFVGGGLGILSLSVRDGYPLAYEYTSSSFHGRRSGVTAYVEGGVELLRLHRGRIGLQLRADLPFGSLRSEQTELLGYHGNPPVPEYGVVLESRYVVPVSIAASVAF